MRFIGCKNRILPFLNEFIKKNNLKGNTFCDLFAGTASVGKYFKTKKYSIISNDLLYFSYVLQKCYLELNSYPSFDNLLSHLKLNSSKDNYSLKFEDYNAKIVINHLNSIEGIEGFITKNYSEKGNRLYFKLINCLKIDAIRIQIEDWKTNNLINENEYFFLLTSLIEAVPFVANISGTYSAFLKEWDPRTFKDLKLEVPNIISSKKEHHVYNQDGIGLINDVKCDILYLDPPYNERQYAPNYHLLETIAKYDNPEIKGKTGMRNYEDQKSTFCNHDSALKSLKYIVEKADYKYLLFSYNNEGLLKKEEIISIFKKYGKVVFEEIDYSRFKSNGNSNNSNRIVKEQLYLLKKVSPKNTLNDLPGDEWLYFLKSVEMTNYSTQGKESFAHHLRKIHPSPKPPQLMKNLIEFFSKKDQLVLDVFAGVGGSLLGCSLCEREGIGIELSEKYVNVYNEVCDELKLKKQKMIIGNSFYIEEILKKSDIEKVDLIITDPPYSNMLSKNKTGEKAKKGNSESTPFTNSKQDLGNLEYNEFLAALKMIIEKSIKLLKLKGYLILFSKDLQPTEQHHNLLHADIVDKLAEIKNLQFKGYKIWYDATGKLYPFGYPYSFVANQFHQYILIFRKEF